MVINPAISWSTSSLMSDGTPRGPVPGAQDPGRDPYPSSGAGASRGKSGGHHPNVGFHPKLYLHVACPIPRRRLGCLESPGAEGPPDEDPAPTDELAVSDDYGKESTAVPLRVRPVDAGNHPDAAGRRVPIEAEPEQRGPAAEATGAELPASAVPGRRAGSGTRSAMAGRGVSPDSAASAAAQGGDLLRR